MIVGDDVPFGRAKTPASPPFARALLNCAVNWFSVELERLLLAWTYFLIAWRLCGKKSAGKRALGGSSCASSLLMAGRRRRPRRRESTNLLPLRSLSYSTQDASVKSPDRARVWCGRKVNRKSRCCGGKARTRRADLRVTARTYVDDGFLDHV